MPLDAVLTLLAGLVLALAVVARSLERLPLSAPLIAFVVGALLAVCGLDVTPGDEGGATELLVQSSRVVLAIGVMGAALALPAGYLRRDWRSLARMLGLIMPAMAASSTLLVHVVTGIDWLPALLVGTIVAPTDPILSRSVVGGSIAKRYLSARLRDLLLAESGANDGLAYPLVLLPLTLGYHHDSAGHWFVRVLLVQVGGAVVLGTGLGLVAGRIVTWAEERGTIDDSHFLIVSSALSLLLLGVAGLLGIDGILMVFVSGLALATGCPGEQLRRRRAAHDATNDVAITVMFVVFGMLAPWRDWLALGWHAAALAVAVLALRRLPWVLLAMRCIPDLRNVREGVLAGWFGPIGVSALFYVGLAEQEGAPRDVWTVGTLLVAVSILAFALSGPPVVRLLGRRGAGPDAGR